MKHRPCFVIPIAAFLFASLGTAALAEPGTRLNGEPLPGTMSRSLNEEHLIKALDGRGNEVTVARTTRAPGTRSPLHMHEYGGTTCVLEGEMTLYLEEAEPARAAAGECYYMPAGKRMAGFNSGESNAVMYDMFIVPAGKPVWKVVEEGAESLQDQFSAQHH